MFIKLGIILLAPLFLMAGVLGATGVLLVDVQEGGPDGVHFVVPVPLVAAQFALTFLPDDCKYVEASDIAPYVPVAEMVVKELRRAPDFVLAEIEDGRDRVLVRKVGDELQVEVTSGRDEGVSCRLPLDGVLTLLRAYDGEGFPAKAALVALRHASRGDIVHVREGGDEVRIRKL